MKKLALALVLLLVPSLAWAQCTGVFPPNTLCGNLSGSPAPPSAFTASSVVGPGSTTVGDIAVWNNTVGSLLKDTPPLQIYGTIGNNLFLSGPSTGGPLNPTFRAITSTDIAAALAAISNPTTQTFLSGSGTYTTPANVKWIEIELQGAGGGGGGSGSGGAGGAGGNTCWNTSGAACTSPVYQAGGGAAGGLANIGGAGGTVSGSGTCYKAITGGTGYGAPSATSNSTSGAGGNSVNGGGAPATTGQAGAAGTTNTGGGGAGGGTAASNSAGNGGGAGANCRAIISAPAGTYTYAVGVAGTAGTAGTQFAGGAGGSGLIVVIEHYAP